MRDTDHAAHHQPPGAVPSAAPSAPVIHAAPDSQSHPAAQADAKTAETRGHHDRHEGHRVEDFRRRFWISLLLTLPILALTPLIQGLLGIQDSLRFPGDGYVLFGLSTLVFLYGGYPFLRGLVRELASGRPGMMTLIGLAITTAYVYSAAVSFGLRGMVFYWELATLLDIMLLGHWIEMRSVMGASRALEELARLMPSEAHRLRPDGTIEKVSLEELRVGDRVLVKPGEKVPADGEVREGTSSVNQAMLTGESQPVEVLAGSVVVGGAVNGEGALVVEIRRTGKDSYLSQVIQLVREAQESKSRTQDLADRAALWLTVIAVAGGAVTLVAWLALAGREFSFALERAVTVMVIACPHALGLAIPLVVAVSTAVSARSGLLIRSRTAFESARNLQAVIFDKTGTLTEGRFAVTDTVGLDGALEASELLRYAASVETHSEHPIARGIAGSADRIYPVQDSRALPGKGAEGQVNGRNVQVVSPGYMKERGLQVSDERIARLSGQGKTVVFVLLEGRPAGAIALADVIRPESREAVARLKEMGIRCLMLTGDNRQVAEWVSGEIGLDEYFAEVLPQQKAAKVREVQSRGLIVAMTGDGVNDAPALTQADVGIAVGAGTDVAIESADIVLVRSNPLDVVSILGLARATYRKMVQNLAWATGYNAIAIPLAAGALYAAGILLSPALGAVFMSLSTVIVAINSRFLKV